MSKFCLVPPFHGNIPYAKYIKNKETTTCCYWREGNRSKKNGRELLKREIHGKNGRCKMVKNKESG